MAACYREQASNSEVRKLRSCYRDLPCCTKMEVSPLLSEKKGKNAEGI